MPGGAEKRKQNCYYVYLLTYLMLASKDQLGFLFSYNLYLFQCEINFLNFSCSGISFYRWHSSRLYHQLFVLCSNTK